MADATIPPGTRRHPRFTLDVPVRLVTDPRGERTAYPARILDASIWGARLATNATLPPDQTVEVIPGGNPTHGVLCRVVWAAEVGPEHEKQMGINFYGAHGVDLWMQ